MNRRFQYSPLHPALPCHLQIITDHHSCLHLIFRNTFRTEICRIDSLAPLETEKCLKPYIGRICASA
jgi:hypothetical protein